MKRIALISVLSLFIVSFSYSQDFLDEWIVPDKEKNNLSIKTFDEDFALEGQFIYENSCTSCHGNPGKADYSIMSPTPGDIISRRFQRQKDGELFYKIKKGKGAMPAFEDALSQEEIWNLVAYIRSFNESYKQEFPNLEGIVIPKLTLKLDFDDNVDKLVVKVLNEEDSSYVEDASVSAYIKSMFGKYSLGKSKTNKLGIAYFDVDYKIPGDSLGNLNIIAKVSKGYGSAKMTEKMQIAKPSEIRSAIEGRHLWSKDNSAPIWLKLFFFASIIGIWGTIIFVVLGLNKIKKVV